MRQAVRHRVVIAEEADIGMVRRTVARYADRLRGWWRERDDATVLVVRA